MLKFSKLGKNLVLPIVTLGVIFLAAGSVVTVATTSSSTSTGIQIILAHPEPVPALKEFCAQYWGEISEDATYCRFEQTLHLNLSHAGGSSVPTLIPVFLGDTVDIAAKVPPQALVGGNPQAIQQTFVASASGYLALRAAYGMNFFSAQQIRVERCFKATDDDQVVSQICPRR